MGAVLVALFSSCEALGGAAPLPEPPETVNVRMVDYRFSLLPEGAESFAPGRTAFFVLNSGSKPHDMVLISIPRDVRRPLIEEVRDQDPRPFPVLFHMPPRHPEARGFFSLDLAPGRYGLFCSVTDPDGTPHAMKGMVAEFRVAE